MAIAQLRRQMAWQAEQLGHEERELQSALLALEGTKKKIDELQKKIVMDKRRLDQYKVEVQRAEETMRKAASDKRRG